MRTASCEKPGDHQCRGARTGLAGIRVIRVVVHGREADATVNDAAISNGGNDVFTLRRATDGRWDVHDG
jgi:hypothetical protein